MKTTIQKTLHVSLCLAILFSLVGSTMSYGMEQDRDQKIASSDAIKYLSKPQITERYLPEEIPGTGTPESNALLWILQKANNEQLDLIERMNNETYHFRLRNAKERDALHSMPTHVRRFLISAFRINL